MTARESSCGTDTEASSSAEGYLQVIARHVPIHRRSALRPLVGWPVVNGLAAGVVAKGFLRRCGARWPACYNEGWGGRRAPVGDEFLGPVRRMERQLRAAVAARASGRDR